MPLSIMQPLSRPPSRDLDTQASRRLSREEAYHLADTARRKSSDKLVREDLRLKISHDHLLELLLQDIARAERERQTSPTEEKYLTPQERKTPTKQRRRTEEVEVDDYGFPLEEEEDGVEDLGGLGLMRTESRRPMR